MAARLNKREKYLRRASTRDLTELQALTKAPTYIADKACKRGHLPLRYSSNRMCVQCAVNFSLDSERADKEAQQAMLRAAGSPEPSMLADSLQDALDLGVIDVPQAFINTVRRLGIRADEPKSYKEAKSRGWHVYFTGEACKHGHISHRYTSTRGCAECARGW